jgi:hypothetical protein
VTPLQLVPDWVMIVAVAVPNLAIGVVILVFRKRIRSFHQVAHHAHERGRRVLDVAIDHRQWALVSGHANALGLRSDQLRAHEVDRSRRRTPPVRVEHSSVSMRARHKTRTPELAT